MRNSLRSLIILSLILLGLSGCSNAKSSGAPVPEAVKGGEVEAGERLFTENGCLACHALTADAPAGIGPSLAGVAARSLETVHKADYTGSATSAEGYLWESITDPRVYMTEGYSPTMPVTYRQSMNDQEIADLVAYLTSLN